MCLTDEEMFYDSIWIAFCEEKYGVGDHSVSGSEREI